MIASTFAAEARRWSWPDVRRSAVKVLRGRGGAAVYFASDDAGYWWIFQTQIAEFRAQHSMTYYEHTDSLVTALDAVSITKGENAYVGGIPLDFRQRFLEAEALLDVT